MSEQVMIVNLTEQNWSVERTYGSYRVPGRKDGEPYATMPIEGRVSRLDLGDGRTFTHAVSAREIAEDLCRQVNSDAGDGSFFGVFVAAGRLPSEEELVEAKGRLETFYGRQVVIADQEWERSRNHTSITDVQRRAARWLGVEKDWCYEPTARVDCPGCGEKVKPNVAVCRTCGAVLDRTKALALGLIAETPVAAKPERQEAVPSESHARVSK